MLLAEARRTEILNLLRREGTIGQRALKEKFQVSAMTITRDLLKLEEQGFLRRVHGGAMLASGAESPNGTAAGEGESVFAERAAQYQDKKEAIGRLAASLVQENQYIFLDGSSTAVQMIRFLRPRTRLTVVTDSLAVLQALAGEKGIEVLVLGGSLQGDRNTIDGPFAVENAERLQMDAMFFSCAGFDEQGIYNAGLIGTNIKRILIQRARRKVLLAHAEKFGQHHFFHICSWDAIDTLVSDGDLAAEARQILGQRQIELLLTERSTSH